MGKTTKVTLKREVRDGWEVIRYIGPLNEEAGIHLLPLYDTVGMQCIFNFSGVTSVNSKGTSTWLSFLRVFREDRKVALEECPDCVVQQINMIPSFALGTDVRSVLAPFVCENCTARASRLVKVGTSLPRVACERCRTTMTMEEDPEEYFLFTQRGNGTGRGAA